METTIVFWYFGSGLSRDYVGLTSVITTDTNRYTYSPPLSR